MGVWMGAGLLLIAIIAGSAFALRSFGQRTSSRSPKGGAHLDHTSHIDHAAYIGEHTHPHAPPDCHRHSHPSLGE